MLKLKSYLMSLTIVFISAFLIQCQNTQNTEAPLPLPEDSFAELYVEILLIKSSIPNPVKYQPIIIPILEKYNITKEQYETILTYYQTNTDQWLEFLDKVSAVVDSLNESQENTLEIFEQNPNTK